MTAVPSFLSRSEIAAMSDEMLKVHLDAMFPDGCRCTCRDRSGCRGKIKSASEFILSARRAKFVSPDSPPKRCDSGTLCNDRENPVRNFIYGIVRKDSRFNTPDYKTWRRINYSYLKEKPVELVKAEVYEWLDLFLARVNSSDLIQTVPTEDILGIHVPLVGSVGSIQIDPALIELFQ